MYRINQNLVRQYGRRFAESNMTATVRIDRPGALALDNTTGQVSSSVADTVYAGKARLTSVAGPLTYQLGEEPQYFSSASVSIPLVVDGVPTTPQVNDVVVITAHHDALMVGRQFRVVDVEASGMFESVRRMQVTGVQRSDNWTPEQNIPDEWYV